VKSRNGRILILGLALGAVGLAWAEEPVVPGRYMLHNAAHGDLLRPKDARSDEGTPLVLYPEQRWKCLTWDIQPAGDADGAVRLKNLFTSKTFRPDPAAGAPTAGVQVGFSAQASDQVWKLRPQTDGTCRVEHAATGGVLQAPAEGGWNAPVSVGPWDGSARQRWKLVRAPDQLDM